MKILRHLIALYIRFKGRDAAKQKAIEKAKRLHLESGSFFYNRKRYRVFFLNYHYQVITRDDIQMRKHAGEYKLNVNSTNMDRLCYFDTNSLKPKL